jgi:oligoribonuclease
VWQDRRFLLRHMPLLESALHYRQIDVSTIKVLARQWYGAAGEAPSKASKHTALDDIRASIDELRWYRDRIFTIAVA